LIHITPSQLHCINLIAKFFSIGAQCQLAEAVNLDAVAPYKALSTLLTAHLSPYVEFQFVHDKQQPLHSKGNA
jgi:hypothetical protein